MKHFKQFFVFALLALFSVSMWAATGDVPVTISYSDIPDGFTATTGTSGSLTATVSSADDLTINYSGINTKSSATAADHAYGYAMFLKNNGYMYSGAAPTGYYPSNVVVTFGSNTGTSGKAGITFGTTSLSTRNSSVTGAVAKSGTCELANTDQTKTYWNFSTTGANVQVDKIVITYSLVSTTSCAAPTFSPAAGAVVSGTEVTINSATEGATIYYTLDETDPTTSSATTQPIVITSATTIKAMAVKSGLDNSSVATAAYTVLTPQTISAIKPTETTEGAEFLLNDVTVTYANGNNVYVKDATGYIMVYSAIAGAENGKVLQGLQGKAKLYYGLPEVSTVTKAPTVTDGSAVAPEALTAYPKAADVNKYVTMEDVTFASAVSFTSGSVTNANGTFDGATLVFRNNFKLNVSLTAGTPYRVVGIVQKYNDNFQIYPISFEEIVSASQVATPTFSPAAGTYTEVQSVTLSCETSDASIYYTTNGDVPTSASTPYTSAISVGETMTIKAIAVKGGMDDSNVASATYTINLPENEEVRKTWDLSIDETATASDDELTWTATYVGMSYAKGTASSNANNYYPGTAGQSYTSTRFYKNGVLTITPSGKQITSIVFTATTTGYANALQSSTWTNGSAAVSDKVVTVTPTDGESAISATIGATCGFTAVQVNYIDIDMTKPETPVFSVAAGTYTEVQNVTITCATEGATIYYTTNGDTPDNTSTEYTAAISVGENMTIKAIAIKDTKSSSVAEAAYVINLPEDENVRKTWDLSTDSYVSDPEPTADLIQWTATYVSMKNERTGTETAVNNYIPTVKTSTRFYSDNKLTITPSGKQISTIVFTATSDAYATALAGSTWTNATAEATGSVVTVTAAGTGAVSAAVGGTCGFTAVQVNYGPIDPSIPDAPTFSVAAGTYTVVQTVEIACATAGATIYYTTDGSTPDNTSTEYTGAITVDATMTIKAIAVKETKSSSVATATYTINLPIVLTTMDAIFAKATEFGNTLTEVQITFDNWVVSGISTDDKNIYVTDGTKGLVIYDKDALKGGFEVNDKLNGTVTCNLKLYRGFSDIDGLKANAAGLTVTKNGTVNPVAATIAELGAVNTGAPIILSNVKYDGSVLTDGTNNITPYTTFFADAVTSLEENKYYNITGIYVHFNTTKEVAPRSAADIEEIVDAEAPEMKWYVDNTKATEITTSYTINLGDAFAPYFETNSSGALTYSSSNDAVATIDPSTGVLALTGTTGSTEISCAVAADATYLADSKSFTLNVRNVTIDNVVILAQYDGKWYAMKSAVASSKAEGIEVNYSDSKIYDLAPADQDAITWKRTTDSEGNVTFQNLSNDQYLKTSSNDLKMEAGETGNYQWTLSEGYYHTGTQTRTFIYRAGTVNAFKSYAVSNAGDGTGTTEYSALPVVTAAVFATTPEVIRGDLSAGKWGTICPKQTVENVEGASFYQITYLEEQNNLPYNVVFDQIEGTTLTAGKPYFFIAEGKEIKGIKTGAELDAADPAGVNGFYGYIGTSSWALPNIHAEYTADADNTFVIYNNSVFRISSDTDLKSERCYININATEPTRTPSSASPVRRRIVMGVQNTNAATGMEELNTSEAPRKMIIDGKMYIFRGEKMYNANGILVK